MPNSHEVNWKGKSPALANVFGEHYRILFQDEMINGKDAEHKWRCDLEWCGSTFFASISQIERRKYGCPCSGPVLSEHLSRHILSELTGFTFRKRRDFDWLRNKEGNKLEVDCHCEDLNWGYEDLGSIHDERTNSRFLSDEEIERQKEHQAIKMEECPKQFDLYVVIPPEIDRTRRGLEDYIKSRIVEGGFEDKIISKEVDWTRFPGKSSNRAKLTDLVRRINLTYPKVRCLAENFCDRLDKLPWDCGEGHPKVLVSYNKADAAIKKRKRLPCRHCSKKVPVSIEEMHAHAREKGGVCKTNELPRAGRSFVEFDCQVPGHEIHRCRASDVRNKPDRCWCELCEPPPRERRTITTQMARALAEKHGHDLHGEYLRNDVKMKVTCKECGQRDDLTFREMENRTGSVWCEACKIRDRLSKILLIPRAE